MVPLTVGGVVNVATFILVASAREVLMASKTSSPPYLNSLSLRRAFRVAASALA
jgi:hypothetical protein